MGGVSNCYVFKSRLQEYAQKVGVRAPAYETVKEGPAHEPYFRSSVVVNDVAYNSLPGFLSRKAAEQSAAEVALLELLKSGAVHHTISLPVHEIGLCKNLLQEYAQKMSFAIPVYQCRAEEGSFQCTVEIGGTRYIGASAKTKKEAEIKAARTALLAIQSSGDEKTKPPLLETPRLTVLPSERRAAAAPEQTPRKAKRARAKRKPLSRPLKKAKSRALETESVSSSACHVSEPIPDQTDPVSDVDSVNVGKSSLESGSALATGSD